MIPAISPDVFRDRNFRQLRWGLAVALYVISSMLASASVGLAAGWIGSWLPAGMLAPIALASCALLYGLHELSLLRLPHPQIGWQAPSGWRRFHPWITALCYGGYLGLGVLHYTFATTFVVVLGWAFLLGDPAASAATMAAFGLGQALPILAVSGRVNSPDEAYAIGCRVLRWQPAVHTINGIALVAASVLVSLTMVVVR